ncbi:c-type cytochrome [Campylobacter hominis]
MTKIYTFILFLCFILNGCNKTNDENNEKENRIILQNATINIKSNNDIIDDKQNFITYDFMGNKKINISPNGEENAVTRQIGAITMVKNPYEKINLNLIEKKLGYNFLLKCSACHNDYANGVIGPSLLKKNEDEIFEKIVSYRDNKVKNVLMKDLVSKMKDDEIRSIAKNISEFNLNFRKSKK